LPEKLPDRRRSRPRRELTFSSPAAFRVLFDPSLDAAAIVAPDGTVLAANATALRRVAGTRLRGLAVGSLFAESHREAATVALLRLFRRASAGRTSTGSAARAGSRGIRLAATRVLFRGKPAFLVKFSPRASPESAGFSGHVTDARTARLFADGDAAIYFRDYAGGRYSFLSPSIRRLTGFAPEDLTPEVWDGLIEREEYAGALAGVARAEARRRFTAGIVPRWQSQVLIRTRSGERRWLMDLASPVHGPDGSFVGSAGILQDISEFRKNEERHRRSRGRGRQAAESVLECEFWIGADGRLDYVDAHSLDVCGYTADAFLDDPGLLQRIVHEEDRPRWAEHVAALLKHRKARELEFRIVRPDGSIRWISHVGQPVFDEDGGFHGVRAGNRDITARRATEDALRASEARLRLMMEQVPAVLWTTDRQGRFTSATGAGLAGLNLVQDQVVGMTLQEFFRTEDELFPVIAAHRRALLGESVKYELTWDDILYEARVDPLRDAAGGVIGVIGIAQDVTEHRKSAERLSSTDRYNSALLQAIPEIILVLDEAAHIEDVREEDARRLALDRAALLGRDLTALGMADHDARRFEEAVRRAVETGNVKDAACSLKTAAGILHWEARIASLDRRRAVAVCRDVTDRKKQEDERRKFEEQIRKTQKLESLAMLAGGVAHDFNNLLVGIIGNADLAVMDLPPQSPALPWVEDIKKAGLRASELTNLLLAYTGRGRFIAAPVDLNVLLEEVSGMLSPAISSRIAVKYRLAERLPLIQADPAQIRQVIVSLVMNAAEAIGEHEGVISITTGLGPVDRAFLRESIANRGLREGPYVFVQVADTGCGIDPATLLRIFDPFFTTKFTGRGLGLAAAQGIVRGHGGAIRVESEPGKGSTFTVVFPPLPSQELLEDRQAAADVSGWKGQGLILIVDDEEAVRDVARRFLERIGFTILTATEGKRGIAMFTEHAGTLRAVLLDLTMPGLTGLDVLQEIRKQRADVPVILMSGYDEHEATQKFANEGLAGFLQKPFNLVTLASRLRTTLAQETGNW
jgi:two-component system, cell cycle sensor histidine kinase and response regulator CckA